MRQHVGVAGQSCWRLVSAEEMRQLDAHTIHELGVDGDLLMESAGRAVTEEVLGALAEEGIGREGRVLVLCGSGNNGGDGLVVARQLHLLDIAVQVLVTRNPEELAGDAAANARRAEKLGIRLEVVKEGSDTLAAIYSADVIVDAIFGTGLAREVQGTAAALIEQVNELADEVCVVAVDLPSGLHADTGQRLGVAVQAARTVTIGSPKLGLALEPGRSLAGAVSVARIGIADEAAGCVPRARLWTPAYAGSVLPARPREDHKGRFGHVLIAAGSEGKTGAAALAAGAAGRSGAGLVTLACPSGLNDVLEVKCTESMTSPLPQTETRSLAYAAEAPLLALAEGKSCIALGPGIGQEAETVALVQAVVPQIAQPLVIDADGLNALVGQLELVRVRSAATVLTPHPGEAARLLDMESAAINADRVGAARTLAERSGAIVLLKGAGSVIASPDGEVIVNPTGGPALGSGGTGDVLTGVVAGFLAQDLPALEAAALAAWVHGQAGDRIAARQGDAGLQAEDLLGELPPTMMALRESAIGEDDLPGLLLPFP